MHLWMGRPPRSAWYPRGPGTDLQGKRSQEKDRCSSQQPKRDHRGGSSTWGLAPERVSVGLANGKQPTLREGGCAPLLSQGDPEDARKTLFPGLEFPVSRKWGESQASHLTLISFRAMRMWTTTILGELDSAGLSRLPSCQAGCSPVRKALLDLWILPTLMKAQTTSPPLFITFPCPPPMPGRHLSTQHESACPAQAYLVSSLPLSSGDHILHTWCTLQGPQCTAHTEVLRTDS